MRIPDISPGVRSWPLAGGVVRGGLTPPPWWPKDTISEESKVPSCTPHLLICQDGGSKATQIVAYPIPPGLTASGEVSVKADGTPIEVESLRPPFPANAPSLVSRAGDRTPGGRHRPLLLRWALHIGDSPEAAGAERARASPGSRHISVHGEETGLGDRRSPRSRYSSSGGDREFTLALPGPCKLLVEMDKLPPLVIFADPPEQNVPRPEDVTHYFGPGVHTPGLITLNDRDQVYIAAGAVVYGGLRGGPRGAKVFGRGILDGSQLGAALGGPDAAPPRSRSRES